MHAAQTEPDPKAFPRGPSKNFVLIEYRDNITRCIYENVVVT
jgi:hypothetical protein